jgi:hypothetical protein
MERMNSPEVLAVLKRMKDRWYENMVCVFPKPSRIVWHVYSRSLNQRWGSGDFSVACSRLPHR